MGRAPFEVEVEGYEPDRGADPDGRAVSKADVARDVSDELREHFDRYPVAPGAGPVTADTASVEDIRKLVDDGVQRALRAPDAPDFDAELAWTWQVVVAVPLTAFLTSLMTEAGKDAYLAMKRLMRRLAAAAARRRGPSAPELRIVELRDADSGLTVTLPDRLPDEAYRQLLTVTLPPLPDGWNPHRLRWFDGHWILEVWADVMVPLVWQAADRRWTLPPDDETGDHLFVR